MSVPHLHLLIIHTQSFVYIHVLFDKCHAILKLLWPHSLLLLHVYSLLFKVLCTLTVTSSRINARTVTTTRLLAATSTNTASKYIQVCIFYVCLLKFVSWLLLGKAFCLPFIHRWRHILTLIFQIETFVGYKCVKSIQKTISRKRPI